MTDDIVARLRAGTGDGLRAHDWMNEAADRIEKLEAEVERLVRSRNKWGKLYNQTLEKLRLSVLSDSEYVKIIDEKCAEQSDRIEKLEAALRDLIAACDAGRHVERGIGGMTIAAQIDRTVIGGIRARAVEDARAALGEAFDDAAT